MNELSIPYHLIIPAIISVIGLVRIVVNRKSLFAKNKLLWKSIMLFLVLYLLITGKAAFEDIYYQFDLNRYDLDKDGTFGGIERTKEQEEAMFRLTNDVGRNFSFITGFIFSTLISSIFYGFGVVIRGIKKTAV
ncbi:MAG: hypothetical protein ABIQ27_05220 [Flavobacterium sp.]|uniref:hypothetical protein n=1 Tax=Flavobacterium sp. TaxID=239 RepID=UPI003264B5C5